MYGKYIRQIFETRYFLKYQRNSILGCKTTETMPKDEFFLEYRDTIINKLKINIFNINDDTMIKAYSKRFL